MRVLLAGGGSGGHVTPLKAVVTELKKQQKQLQITVVSDRSFFKQTQFLFQDETDVRLRRIFAGKFRRYHNMSLVWHVTHVPTVLKNIRDLFYIVLGTLQSLLLFLIFRPDVVFCKGGFVCLPIGLAARLTRKPLIIHDSDTHPGLTNRILSRWAQKIATGAPTKYYRYPPKKTVFTGIPVSSEYIPLSHKKQAAFKEASGFSKDRPLLLVTGGGTGAQQLNDVLLANAETLLKEGWQIALITGAGKAQAAAAFVSSLSPELTPAFQVHEFTDLAPLILAADVVVSRAGATALQELANAQKSVLLVPNPYLTGGHQLKNAEMFMEQNAAYILHESELMVPGEFLRAVLETSADPTIAKNLHRHFAKPGAAKELAALIAKK